MLLRLSKNICCKPKEINFFRTNILSYYFRNAVFAIEKKKVNLFFVCFFAAHVNSYGKFSVRLLKSLL